MPFPLLRTFSGLRPVLIASKNRTSAFAALRYLSSKKSDADIESPPSKKVLAAVTKRATGKKKSTSPPHNSKFVSFDQLPKPPQDIRDMPLDQFYAKVYMRDLPERPVITPSNVFAYKFEIPGRFVRTKHHDLLPFEQPKVDKHDNSFEPSHNILEFKVDYSTNTMVRISDHPLKESITGMFVSNPLMDNIDNDFLWDMYPPGKTFDNAPYGGDSSFDGFRNWEKKQNDKVKQKEVQLESKVKEVQEFKETLKESKSFYRKAPVVKQKTDPAKTAKVGGRKKLDRGLLKQYRKYKKEGLLKKKFNDDDNEEF